MGTHVFHHGESYAGLDDEKAHFVEIKTASYLAR